MRLVRTILAFAISASLVMLPLGASAAGFAMSSGETHASMQMNAPDEMSMDCGTDDMMKGTPSHNHDYKCDMGFCCAGGVVALGDARIMSSEILSTVGSKIAIPADQVVSFRGGSPPFRPPRVGSRNSRREQHACLLARDDDGRVRRWRHDRDQSAAGSSFIELFTLYGGVSQTTLTVWLMGLTPRSVGLTLT